MHNDQRPKNAAFDVPAGCGPGALMDRKQLIETRLRDQGVTLAEDEVEELAETFETLLNWAETVQEMITAEAEPITAIG